MKNIFKVKMNKLLYYTDFLHFKRFGQSISGYMYQAIQMGPVPYRYDAIYDLLTYENYIDFVFAEVNGTQVDKPVALKSFDKALFNPSELEVLDEIFKRFNKINTGELIELSHNEKGWIEENKSKGMISYQKYGYELSINWNESARARFFVCMASFVTSPQPLSFLRRGERIFVVVC